MEMCPGRASAMQYSLCGKMDARAGEKLCCKEKLWGEMQMQRTMGYIRAIVSRILFIGVSVQILLGLLWMFWAFDDRQDFVGSVYGDWLDSYLKGLPYEPVMYLLQVCVAFGAGYWLIEGLGVRRLFWKIWGSLALLTYPFAMQCHMTILPDSLAFSCFLLLLAAGLKHKKTIYLFWLLSALFLPEYLYFGAVPVIAFFFVSAKLQDGFKKIGTELLMIGVVVVMVLGFHNLSSTEHHSLEEAWFCRTVWSSFYQFYPDWPEEVRASITDEEYNAIRTLPENMTKILLPKVKDVLGEENAREWFGKFGTFVFKANREQILSEILKDAGGYMMPQTLVQMRLAGQGGASYCTRNYEIMRAGHPLLTRYYVDYSGIWFVTGAILMFLVLVIVFVGKIVTRQSVDLRDKKSRQWVLPASLLSGILMVIWYTLMEPNLWDPKKALFVGELWILAMVLETIAFEKEDTSAYRNSW